MRPPYATRSIRLVGELQRETAINALRHAPLDSERPVEVVLREEKKLRKQSQSDAMWAGVLRDIAEQAWVDGRQFSAETWHGYFKAQFLPEENDPEIAELAKDGYRKWDIDPGGNRLCVGSTTKLTRKGMARYMQQIEAEGAGLGVLFTERRAA